jgi:homoserine kinase
MPSRTPSPNRLRLALPATSANLGPAFDAAALAMDFYIKLDVRVAEKFSITATGRDREICGNFANGIDNRIQDHLILNTYREVLQAAGRKLKPLSLRIDNDIPIGKGCGSSAAARLAGIALAVHFGRLPWTDAQIIGEASRREHHPDNASACWMGGLTIARMSAPNEFGLNEKAAAEAQVACVRPKGKWPLLLAVPEDSLVHQRSPPRASRAVFARRRGHQRAEFHAAARRLHARPPRAACVGSGRPHPPALSRRALPVAALSAGTERKGWNSRRSPQRRRPLSADLCGSPRLSAKSPPPGRRSPLAPSPHRRVDTHLNHLARSTLFAGQIVIRTCAPHHRLAGGTIPFMRKYSTICP